MGRCLIRGLVLCISWFWLVYCLHENCDTNSGETQHCTKRKDFGIEENERRILLIGKTGVGKSTTGNTILGYEAFKAEASFGSVTSQIKVGKKERFGRDLLVVDTPGVYDTNKTIKEVMIEIAKCYGVTTPGLHAIVFVMEVGRFTNEDNKTVELYHKFFGESLSKYMVLVFTGKDKLERDGRTIENYVNSIPNKPETRDFRNLIENIQNRYMAFGLKGNINEREGEVKYFLDLIDKVFAMNGENYYTNDMFVEAEQIMNARLVEEKRKLKENHEYEIRALKASRGRYTDEEIEELIEQKILKYMEKMLKIDIHIRVECRSESESGGGSFFFQILNTIFSFVAGGVVSFFSSWW